MTTPNKERLSKLLKRHGRSVDAREKVKAWKLAGFVASPLAHDRHEELIEKLQTVATHRERKSVPLSQALAEVAAGSDVVAVMGWSIEVDSGVLLTRRALNQSETFWRKTYPDGFFVCNQHLTRILIIDFDESSYLIEEFWFSGQ
ncbi:hypothetical protein [Sphingobium sp. CFD-2]|uniref:hypothetical protein n=1 Tax=Sphingobium sp. CFD-2 TaxID=2878542 RepID=UPI00214AC59F|nr:hypothetical protein [Sphingobium sp. CFD-2]